MRNLLGKESCRDVGYDIEQNTELVKYEICEVKTAVRKWKELYRKSG
jgi:hypothetical protein